jgi:hypothetical protein
VKRLTPDFSQAAAQALTRKTVPRKLRHIAEYAAQDGATAFDIEIAQFRELADTIGFRDRLFRGEAR